MKIFSDGDGKYQTLKNRETLLENSIESKEYQMERFSFMLYDFLLVKTLISSTNEDLIQLMRKIDLQFRPIFTKKNRQLGAFTNYVDKILASFDHLPPCVDIFYGINVDKK